MFQKVLLVFGALFFFWPNLIITRNMWSEVHSHRGGLFSSPSENSKRTFLMDFTVERKGEGHSLFLSGEVFFAFFV